MSLKKFYHVTFKNRVPKILYDGIKAGKSRIWVNRYGKRLGRKGRVNYIYAHGDWETAVRWAYKQTWDFNKKTLIVEFKEYLDNMECNITLLGSVEFMKQGDIEPEQITDIYDVESEKFLH